MKKIIFILLMSFALGNLKSQITLNHTCYDVDYLVKLSTNGYKYASTTYTSITLYNLNHTVYKTMSVPSITTTPVYLSIYYISDNLFDLDNGVEYLVYRYKTIAPYYSGMTIVDESGTILFNRDSAFVTGQIGGAGYKTAFYNQDPIYFDGTNVKLKLDIFAHPTGLGSGYMRTEVYDLPGTMPCVGCSSGIVSNIISSSGDSNSESAEFFPNPTSGQLKLKYKLPDGSNLAEMKIYDMQGKLMDEFKVTDHYDFIYLPTNYNNGLYLYSLIVDGKIVKTEKIILNK